MKAVSAKNTFDIETPSISRDQPILWDGVDRLLFSGEFPMTTFSEITIAPPLCMNGCKLAL